MVTVLHNISSGSSPEPALSRAGHTAAAVALGFILVLGFVGNFLVLLVFARFPALRTPISLLLINISVSDILVCIFGTPLSFAASVRGRWLTGAHGCRWYGFSNALFGIVSLVSLSLLSFERCSAVLGPPRSDSVQFVRARLAIAVSWIYSLAWTLPPLFGWSSYGPEGPGTTCSVQWNQRSDSSRSYIGCLFVFCLLLPLLLMLFCYGTILLAVRGVSRQVDQSAAERREARVLLMVVSMVTGYVLCWVPYGVVAMLSAFGRPRSLPPAASLVPSLLAKTSTVLNPFIYVLLNDQFSRCFLYMVRCGPEDQPAGDHQTLASSGALPPETERSPSEHTWPNVFPSPEQQGEPPPAQEGS